VEDILMQGHHQLFRGLPRRIDVGLAYAASIQRYVPELNQTDLFATSRNLMADVSSSNTVVVVTIVMETE
jgi:hypothetical protein